MSDDGPSEPPELIRAVRATQLGRLEELLAQGGDPNTRSKAGRTALHAAAEEGILEAAKLLLDAGAQVDARNWAGETPLHRAAQYGRGGHLDDPDEEMRPPSRRRLVPEIGRPECLAIAELLIDRGADVNALDKGGGSVLSEAVGFADLAMIELLVARGADPNNRGDGKRAPLESAISFRRFDVAKLLRRAGAEIEAPGVHALHVAAGMGCLTVNGVRTVDYVRWLLEEGARVDGPDGFTAPLILAAHTSDAESVQVLLEHGASVEARTSNLGETALFAGARELSFDVVRLLLAAGARVNARDSSGGTVLHAVAGQDYNGLEDRRVAEMCRFLLDHGADRAARDDEGLTAFDWALRAALPADVLALLGTPAGE